MTNRKPNSAYPIKPLAVNSTITIATRQGELDGQSQPLVNARDLHAFLDVGRDFSNWIKSRIRDYQFLENADYIEFSPKLAKTSIFGGRPKMEYHISLDMAKELAMVERNDKGRLARRYFIDVEKRAVAKAQQALTSQQSWLIKDLQAQLLAAKPLWKAIKRYKQLGLNHVEIGKLVDRDQSTIRDHVRKMERYGILPPPKNLAKLQRMALILQSPKTQPAHTETTGSPCTVTDWERNNLPPILWGQGYHAGNLPKGMGGGAK